MNNRNEFQKHHAIIGLAELIWCLQELDLQDAVKSLKAIGLLNIEEVETPTVHVDQQVS